MRTVLFCVISILIACDKRQDQDDADCVAPSIVPPQTYSHPVWHPNGNLLGFNHVPYSNIQPNGTAPCIWYSYITKPDSAGFYLMNKDRTGFKRVTTFQIFAPAWSPDGNWIAFSVGSNIYKMKFNGVNFDTANRIQLTNSGGNFHPSWTANSDSIYYDSNLSSGGSSFYSIWKMAADGSGKQRIVDPTGLGDIRFPFVGSNGWVYHSRYVSGQPEVFSMRKDGSDVQQLTWNSKSGNRNSPQYLQNVLFYNDNGTLRKIQNGSDIQLTFPAVTYAVSPTGEVVYSKMNFSILDFDKQKGTLWIMNTDGTNNRQLTFNNF